MEHLKALHTECGDLQKDVAAAPGIDRTTCVKYEKRQSESSLDILTKSPDYFGVSADYILSKETKEVASGDLKKYGLLLIKMRKFRVLGEIACGNPIFADEDREPLILADEPSFSKARSGSSKVV